MENLTQIDFQDIDEAKEYEEIIEKVVYECFKEEDLLETKLYMSIILTNKDKIQELNNTYRKINKTTDVLSHISGGSEFKKNNNKAPFLWKKLNTTFT